ncbi:MAG: ribosome biogenesis GTP-binding protein YihA/YsxC, partial [bacterium]
IPGTTLPQVAFVGRSNVGKSSLINRLLERQNKKIARVSATPGKTQSMNFYKINDLFIMVDLPGWGYAKAPIRLREKWEQLVKTYIQDSERLMGVVHLIDARHPPTKIDFQLLNFLTIEQTPNLIVLTKTDKLSKIKRKQALQLMTRELEIQEDQIVLTSSKTGTGRTELIEAIEALLRP